MANGSSCRSLATVRDGFALVIAHRGSVAEARLSAGALTAMTDCRSHDGSLGVAVPVALQLHSCVMVAGSALRCRVVVLEKHWRSALVPGRRRRAGTGLDHLLAACLVARVLEAGGRPRLGLMGDCCGAATVPRRPVASRPGDRRHEP